MDLRLSQCSLEEMREMRAAIDKEITRRKNEVRESRFNEMMKAIRDFKEVCPDAKVCDYEYSVFISYIADRDNWEFGE